MTKIKKIKKWIKENPKKAILIGLGAAASVVAGISIIKLKKENNILNTQINKMDAYGQYCTSVGYDKGYEDGFSEFPDRHDVLTGSKLVKELKSDMETNPDHYANVDYETHTLIDLNGNEVPPKENRDYKIYPGYLEEKERGL